LTIKLEMGLKSQKERKKKTFSFFSGNDKNNCAEFGNNVNEERKLKSN
jgi:hypothetical protein